MEPYAIEEARIPLGIKEDHRLWQYALDSSDRDAGINLVDRTLKGLFVPNGVAA
jgi:hypothetical protein